MLKHRARIALVVLLSAGCASTGNYGTPVDLTGGAPASGAGTPGVGGSGSGPAQSGSSSGGTLGSGGNPALACNTPGLAEPPQTPLTFSPSSEDFVNPERGFHEDFPLPADSIGDLRSAGFSLLRSYVILSDFRSGPISAAFLGQLQNDFNLARDAGIKLVLRFAYNRDGTDDAPFASVLQHIAQLKPLLQDNADIIALIQAGFIGQWGEWHDSKYGINVLDDRKQILQALLDAVPSSRMVQLRYPWHRKQIFQTLLLDATAFSGTGAARVGLHNDCFMTNDDDYGTYGTFTNDPSGNPSSSDIASWKDYTAAESRYVAMGGETCDDLARSACSTSTAELARFHFSYLNARYEPKVNDRWTSEGCMPDIRRRLGYRFALTSGSSNGRVAPGGLLQLKFSVQNGGYAAPYNARPIYVVLDGPVRVSALLSPDIRRWAPELGAIPISAVLRVPATLTPGSYRVALSLPDAAPSLAKRPEYAIQLANTGVWNAVSGDNTLLAELTVDSNAGGCVDPTAASFAEVGQ